MRTREAPWIGIGQTGSWTDPHEAILADAWPLDVQMEPAFTADGRLLPNTYATQDQATGSVLGTVSGNYGVIQADKAAEMMEPFCAAGGVIKHVGHTQAGMYFMIAEMKETQWDGDDYIVNVCMMNSYNTCFPFTIFISPIRVICQNMFPKLTHTAPKVLNLRHTRLIDERISTIGDINSRLIEYMTDFGESLSMAKLHALSGTDVQDFADKMLPYPKDVGQVNYGGICEQIDNLRQLWIDEYYGASDNLKYRGTGLGLINAYYDWISHADPRRKNMHYEEQRLGNLFLGTAVDTKLLKSAY